jgi:myosin heavy subunit
MFNIRRRDPFNFYESFSDMIFCTLVLFLVMVLFLALNVNRRIEDVRETEKSLESKQMGFKQALGKLETEKTRIQGVREKHKSEIERLKKLETEEAGLVKLKKALKAEIKQIEEIENKEADIIKRKEEIQKQTVFITNRIEELKKEELNIATQKEKLKVNEDEIAVLEKLDEFIKAKETARNRPYETAGVDDNGELVPCRWQYSVLLVLGEKAMTFEGRRTNKKELPALLAKVPNRDQTVFRVAVTDELSRSKTGDAALERALDDLKPLSKQFGFESIDIAGISRLGSKETDWPKLVPVKISRK